MKNNEPKLINQKNYYIKYVWDLHPSKTALSFNTEHLENPRKWLGMFGNDMAAF